MKETRVEELIDTLYEMIEESSRLTFSGSFKDKLLDMLDEVKSNIPTEMQMAREIVSKRDAIIAAANREADKTRSVAEEYARQLVSENEITVEARRRAADTLEKAEKNAAELRRSAAVYCDDIMRRAEQSLGQVSKELSSARAQFNRITEEGK